MRMKEKHKVPIDAGAASPSAEPLHNSGDEARYLKK